MKFQNPSSKKFYLRPRGLGVCCLTLLWCLVLGCWSFRASAADTNTILDAWFAGVYLRHLVGGFHPDSAR